MKAHILTILFALQVGPVLAEKSTFVFRMQSVNTGHLDDATIFFNEGVNPAFYTGEDEEEGFNPIDGAPALYSFSLEGTSCNKNGFGDLTTTEIIPVGVKVGTNGNYKFTALAIDGFDATCVIRLEDRQAGVFTNLRTQDYTISLNTNILDSGRFYVHVTHAAQFTYQNSGCLNNEGSITVTIDPSVPWDVCQLYDTANNPLQTVTNVDQVAIFTGLSQGEYYVAFLAGIYSSGKYFHLSGNHIVSAIQSPAQTIFVNQQTVFHAVATNSTQYEWDFGDGTLITGVAHPPVTYYTPGTYIVNLTCSNSYGCSSSSQVTVTVDMPSVINEEGKDKLNILTQGKIITLERIGGFSVGSSIQIHNLIGVSVYTAEWNTATKTVDLGTQAAGYYFLFVREGNSITTQRIYLER